MQSSTIGLHTHCVRDAQITHRIPKLSMGRSHLTACYRHIPDYIVVETASWRGSRRLPDNQAERRAARHFGKRGGFIMNYNIKWTSQKGNVFLTKTNITTEEVRIIMAGILREPTPPGACQGDIIQITILPNPSVDSSVSAVSEAEAERNGGMPRSGRMPGLEGDGASAKGEERSPEVVSGGSPTTEGRGLGVASEAELCGAGSSVGNRDGCPEIASLQCGYCKEWFCSRHLPLNDGSNDLLCYDCSQLPDDPLQHPPRSPPVTSVNEGIPPPKSL